MKLITVVALSTFKQVKDALLEIAQKLGVVVVTNTRVRSIDAFRPPGLGLERPYVSGVQLDSGRSLKADVVVSNRYVVTLNINACSIDQNLFVPCNLHATPWLQTILQSHLCEYSCTSFLGFAFTDGLCMSSSAAATFPMFGHDDDVYR